ncbi:hypothetical protein ACFSJW_08980 [Flavobacterium artemisiae]|uniref:Sortilin N-terminal domain-containing protein n=1 Tax=Flavobacterium artemisiae TaxID=2126556 RepID=A0ABW4HFB1_9FLAO
MRKFKILVLALLCFGCVDRSSNKTNQATDEVSLSHTDIKSLEKEEQTAEKYITNITDISKDTVIACNYISGLMFSRNGGKIWKHFKTSLMFKDVTYTDKKNLVGIDSWQGIHEPSYAKMHISKDFGNSWETITFDTEIFFPVKIVSDPKEPLSILTDENKIYKLKGTNYKKDWVYVKTIPEPELTRDEIDYPYGAHERFENVKLYKMGPHKTDTLAHLNLCSEIREIAQKDSVVHIAGTGYDKKSGKEYGYYAQFINDKILRQYKFPGWFVNIHKTKFNVYIVSENGLYKEKNGKIEQLY